MAKAACCSICAPQQRPLWDLRAMELVWALNYGSVDMYKKDKAENLLTLLHSLDGPSTAERQVAKQAGT